MKRYRLRTAVNVATLSMLFAACSSASTGTGTSTSTAASTSTVGTAATTTAPTTTEATTTVPATIVFTLRGDGLGPFDFGSATTDLIDALTTAFGAAVSDDTTEYPADDGSGGFQTTDGDLAFVAQFGRTMCWSGQLCAQFGGAGPTVQTFMGWTLGEASATSLTSTSGVTIGSRWSDFPAMVVDPGGCYTVGDGTIDGIHLALLSADVAFGSFDDLGNYVEAVPPADQVTVTWMDAGENPVFLFGDC